MPQSVKRTRNPAAQLLWDNPEYALGVLHDGRDVDAAEKHRLFIERVGNLLLDAIPDIAALLVFLQHPDKRSLLEQFPEWEEMLKEGRSLSFKLTGASEPVFRHPDVVAAIDSPDEVETALFWALGCFRAR